MNMEELRSAKRELDHFLTHTSRINTHVTGRRAPEHAETQPANMQTIFTLLDAIDNLTNRFDALVARFYKLESLCNFDNREEV